MLIRLLLEFIGKERDEAWKNMAVQKAGPA